LSPRTVHPASDGIQRRGDDAKPSPESEPMPRVRAQSSPSVMRSLDMPLHKQSESKTEAPPADGEKTPPGMVTFQNPPIPSQSIVQRAPDAKPPVPMPTGSAPKGKTAEQAKKDEAERQETGEKKDELEDLAQKVYPLIKRMFAIERERRPGL